MVVDYSHVMCVAFGPTKYEPPLVVDADRIESFQITPQLLEPIGGRHAQILKSSRNVNGNELSFCSIGEPVERTDEFIFEERLGFAVAKRPDHDSVYRIPVYGQYDEKRLPPL
jgi:hypothetical protein